MSEAYARWDEGPILAQVRNRVLTVTLNRPERKNALNSQCWDEIFDVLRTAEVDPDIRAVVLTGAGDAFCAGADISTPPVGHPITRVTRIAHTADYLFQYPKPVIAKVDGAAVGAGFNLALLADFVVATPRSKFSEIFVQRGLSVDFGGSWLLPHLLGLQRAKQLAMLGDMLSAHEAEAWGLVTWLQEAEDIDAFVDELAGRLARGAPIAQALNKTLVTEGSTSSFQQALAAEVRAQAVNYGTGDAAAAREAFGDKRIPSFTGEWTL